MWLASFIVLSSGQTWNCIFLLALLSSSIILLSMRFLSRSCVTWTPLSRGAASRHFCSAYNCEACCLFCAYLDRAMDGPAESADPKDSCLSFD